MHVRSPWVAAAIIALFVGSTASAELAPSPVENGDVYFSAGVALYYYKTDDMGVARIYANDDFSGTGVVSDAHPRGFLVDFEMNSDEVVTPEVNFGYAFEEPLFKGALGSQTRLHISAYGNRREGQDFKAIAAPPVAAFPLVNPTTGVVELRDGVIVMQPADGSTQLPNGDQARYWFTFPLDNNSMSYRTYFGSGDMMIYFDEPEGQFHFTRGAGLTVGYERSQFAWGINSTSLGTAFPGIAPASWTYSFQQSTLYVGPRMGFSIGFEPVRALSAFVAGGFAPMLAFSSITGSEIGQCLATCNVGAATGTVGISTVSGTDLNFAYDARMEVGVSFYVYVIRLTATVGGFASNQFAMPREGEFGRFETALADQWGYYGRAMATFAFR